jgi:hypothetical protein
VFASLPALASALRFERYGLDWRSVQSEVRQGFIDTFQVEYQAETGKPLPLKPADPGMEFLHIFAYNVARWMQVMTPII